MREKVTFLLFPIRHTCFLYNEHFIVQKTFIELLIPLSW